MTAGPVDMKLPNNLYELPHMKRKDNELAEKCMYT